MRLKRALKVRDIFDASYYALSELCRYNAFTQGRRAPLRYALAPGFHIPRLWRCRFQVRSWVSWYRSLESARRSSDCEECKKKWSPGNIRTVTAEVVCSRHPSRFSRGTSSSCKPPNTK